MSYLLNDTDVVFNSTNGTTNPVILALMTDIQKFVDDKKTGADASLKKAFSKVDSQKLTKAPNGWLNLLFVAGTTVKEIKLVADSLNAAGLSYNTYKWGKAYTSKGNKFNGVSYIAIGKRAENFTYGTGMRSGSFSKSAVQIKSVAGQKFTHRGNSAQMRAISKP